MRRRRLLSALAATVVTAGTSGCLGDGSAGDGTSGGGPSEGGQPGTGSSGEQVPDRTGTRGPETSGGNRATTTSGVADGSATTAESSRSPLSPGETFATGDGRELAVSAPVLRRLVVVLEEVSHHDYHRVAAAPAGEQYLVVTLSRDGFDVDDPAAIPLSVVLDGERHADRTRVFPPTASDWETAPTQVGLLVPVTDAASGAVVWDREDGPAVRWRLPDGVLSAVGTAPAFAVRDLTVPDAVEYGDPIPVRFTVANEGDRDGRFVVECDARQGSLPLDEATVTVPAGEHVRRTVDVAPYYESGIETVPVVFDWGRDRTERTVSVRGGETASR